MNSTSTSGTVGTGGSTTAAGGGNPPPFILILEQCLARIDHARARTGSGKDAPKPAVTMAASSETPRKEQNDRP